MSRTRGRSVKSSQQQLEGLTAELDRLTPADKAELRAFMVREAASHPVAAVATEILQFVEAAFSEED